jgi:hypothetical protein
MLDIQVNGMTLRNEIDEWHIHICFSSYNTKCDRSSYYDCLLILDGCTQELLNQWLVKLSTTTVSQFPTIFIKPINILIL